MSFFTCDGWKKLSGGDEELSIYAGGRATLFTIHLRNRGKSYSLDVSFGGGMYYVPTSALPLRFKRYYRTVDGAKKDALRLIKRLAKLFMQDSKTFPETIAIQEMLQKMGVAT